ELVPDQRHVDEYCHRVRFDGLRTGTGQKSVDEADACARTREHGWELVDIDGKQLHVDADPREAGCDLAVVDVASRLCLDIVRHQEAQPHGSPTYDAQASGDSRSTTSTEARPATTDDWASRSHTQRVSTSVVVTNPSNSGRSSRFW